MYMCDTEFYSFQISLDSIITLVHIVAQVLSTVQSGSGDPPVQIMTSSPTPEPPDSPGSHEREVWSPSRGGRDESFGGWHKVAAVHRYYVLLSLVSY